MNKTYRIQERKYSSNIIEKNYPYIDENGKKKDKWKPYLAPLESKVDGDKLCYEFFKYLTY